MYVYLLNLRTCIYKILNPTLLTPNDEYAVQAVPLLLNAMNERWRFTTSRILACRQSHSQIPEMNDSSTVKTGTERPLRRSRIQWRWWWRSPIPFFTNSIDRLTLRNVSLLYLGFLNRPVRRMRGRVVGDGLLSRFFISTTSRKENQAI